MTSIDIEGRTVRAQDFVTKDSGAREEYDSGMVRDSNEGKPAFELLLADGIPFEEQMLTRIAALMARGAEKYSAKNWLKASGQQELDRFKTSAFRHFVQWLVSDWDADQATEDHGAAVYFNIMGAEYVKTKMRMQDAIKEG